jgi:hypothetical protein
MEADMENVTLARTGNQDDAEALAIKVLGFIVADLDRTVQFLNVTGLQPETIRESAKSSLFLLGVLDYASKDEELLKEIEKELDIRPASILVASVYLTPKQETSVPTEKPAIAPAPRRRPLFQ